MMRPFKVPPELAAVHAMQRASTREIGVPLYLPAFETTLLEAGALHADDGDRTAVSDLADTDEDDDFY